MTAHPTLVESPAVEAHLGFAVGADDFAVPLERIVDIRRLRQTVPVFLAPRYGAGFAMTHGGALPVVDLRVAFGAPAGLDESTSLLTVLLKIGPSAEPHRVGLVVDWVEGAMTLEPAQFLAPPVFAPECSADFVRGTTVGGRFVLELDRLLPL